MNFAELLVENKIKIVETWIGRVLSTYSADSAVFFKKQKDRFANPLGYSVENGLTNLFDLILKKEKVEELPKELAQFIKLRAVQDMSPSMALSFFYELKDVVKDVCGSKKLCTYFDDWNKFEREVDRLTFVGFDLYMKDRELLSQIKVNEFKRGNSVGGEGGMQCPSVLMRKNKDTNLEQQVLQKC